MYRVLGTWALYFIFTKHSFAARVVCLYLCRPWWGPALVTVACGSNTHVCTNSSLSLWPCFINADWVQEKEGSHHSQVGLTYLYGFIMNLKPATQGLPVLKPREVIKTRSVKLGQCTPIQLSACALFSFFLWITKFQTAHTPFFPLKSIPRPDGKHT